LSLSAELKNWFGACHFFFLTSVVFLWGDFNLSQTTETMAMQGCYCHHHVKLVTQRRTLDSLSFSGSISVNKLSKNIRTTTCDPSKNNPFPKFLVVRMRQTELPLPVSKNGAANGRAVKMVPTTELVNRKTMSANKVEKTVNGSASKVNRASPVRKKPMPGMTKTVKSRTRTSRELPSLEELKVLPSDEGFSWANEHYSSWQRSIDVWSFVVSFRIRILLDNSKWAYLRGFTEAKQVGSEFCWLPTKFSILTWFVVLGGRNKLVFWSCFWLSFCALSELRFF